MTESRLLEGRPESVVARPDFSVKLVGARIALDARTALPGDIEIENGRIRSLIMPAQSRPGPGRSTAFRPVISLPGCLILPGLINAHDHLEFNLLPRLGRGCHSSFEDWARDIYHPERSPLREHLAVPKPVRLWWGALKNLVSGVTTVCHHNPYDAGLFEEDFPVKVVRRYAWAHSLAFGENIRRAFDAAPPGAPFIIHLGEGTDGASSTEIFELDRLGCLDFRTVIVHGVGLDRAGHALLKARGAALVWCPSSNLFTLGATLEGQVVEHLGRVALGTDSALTAQGDLLDEIAVAHRQGRISPERIYSLVTERAADVLRLQEGEGTLRPGAPADLVAIKEGGLAPAESLIRSNFRQVELVMVGGQPQLVSPAVARLFPKEMLAGFEPLQVNGAARMVRAPVGWLWEEAKKRLGVQVRLAGKLITA
ncbi:MAG: amidohydrolase family protein [Acidobacteria bacterium]|nr:amidohydrolase family protein [Acidobacteriota bacterium]